MQKIERSKRTNEGVEEAPLHRVEKRRHTITVFVWPVQREQEEVDSDKTLPLFETKVQKKEALPKCWSDKISRPGKVRLLWLLLLY